MTLGDHAFDPVANLQRIYLGALGADEAAAVRLGAAVTFKYARAPMPTVYARVAGYPWHRMGRLLNLSLLHTLQRLCAQHNNWCVRAAGAAWLPDEVTPWPNPPSTPTH